MIKSTQRLKIQPNISSDTMSFTKLLHILTLAVVFMAAVIIPKGMITLLLIHMYVMLLLYVSFYY